MVYVGNVPATAKTHFLGLLNINPDNANSLLSGYTGKWVFCDGVFTPFSRMTTLLLYLRISNEVLKYVFNGLLLLGNWVMLKSQAILM